MIIDAIVSLLFGLLSAVFGLLPEWGEFAPERDSLADGAIGQMGAFLGMLNHFVPIELMFACLLFLLAAKVFAGGVHFVAWVWDKLPFKAS